MSPSSPMTAYEMLRNGHDSRRSASPWKEHLAPTLRRRRDVNANEPMESGVSAPTARLSVRPDNGANTNPWRFL
ncbi:hypothetical protein [Nonomuraea jiangxiensis]|uniref:Uncharacterized protein n=1 Tax=Nonomuraea jiangxiensis TaxID=633440 RepID=A0A1G8S5T6_9ACTN|nr:hypothetical protein [Nonomuraea jiangxiensis]SDJ24557.1 hypothetical protein SAMN05421869_109280 [Nonomuraea jiangxiensis]